MIIAGFDKVSLTNYPGLVACTIFTNNCNFKCPFCQNGTLAKGIEKSRISEDEIFNYLKKREGLIDGICISGGEPTIQKDLVDFIKKLRAFKIKIKLDTNGSNPEIVKYLIDNNLIDYVAMDIKNTFKKYDDTSGTKVDLAKIKETIKILKNSEIDYEFRTTIIREYHSLDDIKSICKYISPSKYYLQNFEDSDNVLKNNLHGFSTEELKEIENKIRKEFPNVSVRGI